MEEHVNHPKHYASGKFECIAVMRDVFGDEAVMNFCLLKTAEKSLASAMGMVMQQSTF